MIKLITHFHADHQHHSYLQQLLLIRHLLLVADQPLVFLLSTKRLPPLTLRVPYFIHWHPPPFSPLLSLAR